MVQQYNTRIANQGLSAYEMRAVCGNLIDASAPSPPEFAGAEFHDFDVAVVGLGFHHFDDPALATRRLAARLKKGGVLFIVDFLPHDAFEPDSDVGKTVRHLGFSRDIVEEMFVAAGVGGSFDMVDIGDAKSHVKFGKERVEKEGKEEGEHAHGHGHGHDHDHDHSHSHGFGSLRRKVFMARGTKI